MKCTKFKTHVQSDCFLFLRRCHCHRLRRRLGSLFSSFKLWNSLPDLLERQLILKLLENF